MGKKIQKYTPPPVPDVSHEDAVALEARLRKQADSWGYLQGDRPNTVSKNKFIDWLLPPRKRQKSP